MFKTSQIELNTSNYKLNNFSFPLYYKSFRLSVNFNQIRTVIKKMLFYHCEEEERDKWESFNSLLLQEIPRD